MRTIDLIWRIVAIPLDIVLLYWLYRTIRSLFRREIWDGWMEEGRK